MRTTSKSILSSVFAVAFAVLPLFAKNQEKSSASTTPVAPAASASPEMEKLKFYLGEWDYTETYPPSKRFQSGAKNTGVYVSRPGPGGNSLINEFHSQGPVGDFSGLLAMTWDPQEKTYKAYFFNNEFPGAVVETGTWEGDNLVYRFAVSMGPTTVKMRNVTHLTADGKLIAEAYSAVGDKPEKLLVTVEATKR